MNEDLACANLGPCEEHEFELVEWLDGDLAPDRAVAVRRHVAGCARCRAFAREMQAIDAALASALPRVQLAADFESRLHARIGGLRRTVPKDVALAAAAKEYESVLRTLRRGLTWRTALNAGAAAAVGGGVALGFGPLAPGWFESLRAFAPLLGVAGPYVTAIAVAGGLAAPFLLRRLSGSPLLG